MTEIWKDIVGYEGIYQVSNLGRVKSLQRFVKLKQNLNRIVRERILVPIKRDGYLVVNLSKNNYHKLYIIHRLVASSFIPNLENKKEVNHINGVREDNRLENLEWCTRSENQLHAYQIGLQKKINEKVVLMYDMNKNFIKEFVSVKDASRKTGLFSSNISKVCLGKRNHTNNYIFEYK
jgi:hypothetical protein